MWSRSSPEFSDGLGRSATFRTPFRRDVHLERFFRALREGRRWEHPKARRKLGSKRLAYPESRRGTRLLYAGPQSRKALRGSSGLHGISDIFSSKATLARKVRQTRAYLAVKRKARDSPWDSFSPFLFIFISL